MERCACCDRMLSPVARFGSWCEGCTRGVWKDAGLLASGGAEETRMTVSWLLDHGCLTLARFVMKVPFGEYEYHEHS